MTSAASIPIADLAVSGERLLTLSDGRTLAYAVGGDQTSRKLALTLHGVFGVGTIEPAASALYASLGWRCLSPTLPGWGKSSPFPPHTPVSAFAADVQELLAHLGGGTPSHLLVFGGSYGTIWAYAVAANTPPPGRAPISPPGVIRGLVVMGAFSNYRDEEGYAAACEGMTMFNWLGVGRPSQWCLTSWIHPLVGRIIQTRLTGGVPAAIDMLRSILTGPKAMTPAERAEMEAWATSLGTDFDSWERSMATNMVLSVRDTIVGFTAVPGVINGDWGFALEDVRVAGAVDAATPEKKATLHLSGGGDIPATLPPVVVAGATRDELSPIAMQRFVAGRLPGAQLIELGGNHISGITSMFAILTAVIRGIEGADAAATGGRGR